MNSFYTDVELKNMGFKSYGKNVLVSKKASIYGAEHISLGHDVRIDDFCILSGHIEIGNYVHIAAFVGMWAGKTGIKIGDFAGISARTLLYAETDDYSGAVLTNLMVPTKYKNVICSKIIIGKHSIIGSGSIILPGVIMGEGVAVGAGSLIIKSCDPWCIYVGTPAKALKARKKELLQLEKEFLKTE
jgi:galactoside O-acetyltransferase